VKRSRAKKRQPETQSKGGLGQGNSSNVITTIQGGPVQESRGKTSGKIVPFDDGGMRNGAPMGVYRPGSVN